MPWEKTFDLDEATDKAISVFWKKGYEGTSMADLTAGMEINKGSLYNAFGSKQALFDRALLRYDQQTRAAMLAELATFDDPVAAITELFDRMIDAGCKDQRNLGCFLINTAQDLPNQTPDVTEIVRTSLAEIEDFLRAMLRRGQKTGQISEQLDVETTAQSLLAMFAGLRLLSRGAVAPQVLEGVRSGVQQLLDG
ncbi:TetR/AcrR family transcriptional regulator [Roseobacter sinensis]|uniref:TetR/AcrR family transcriptional regulator n=1 Tax=Roseobacter sinensis TaxID=2931391 RepID=A0ABT3BM06_9RHOB|nr:TetR/AcrR family transcriptional regulator [Roseobacter sp. WL0113]MCV3274244.1 TetR/AcrR family transcriptional regulator [Roseobacter sp. WL0113]